MADAQILLITAAAEEAVLPPDHQLGSLTRVAPPIALRTLEDLWQRRVPVAVVADAATVHLPSFLTEFAIKFKEVPVVVATATQASPPVIAARGVWRAARSPELVAAIRAAARTAAQQARVRTTIDRLNIRLRQPAMDDQQQYRMLLSGLYFSHILQQATDGVFVTDRRGIVAVWNATAERVFGLTGQEIIGHSIETLPEAGAALAAVVAQLSPEAPHQVAEFALKGGQTELEIALTLISDNTGAGIAVSGIVRDMTEQKALVRTLQDQTEALRASNRHKEEFLAVLSHELRTPLNAVLGWTQLLMQRPDDVTHVRRATESIDRNARVQWRLVTDLLDFAKISAGHLTLNRAVVDLCALVESTVESIRPELEGRELVLEEACEAAVFVFADGERVAQVLTNLLTNAMKFTPREGRIAVSVSTVQGLAQVEVRDTGQGIAPEFLPHLFDPFKQADSTMTSAQGLGLGLAITQRIMQLHGGTVTAASEGLGHGATFRVTLAAVPGPQPSGQASLPSQV